jgi:hypothetical protein
MENNQYTERQIQKANDFKNKINTAYQQYLKNLSKTQKQAICRKFAQKGIEVSPNELEKLIDFIVKIR